MTHIIMLFTIGVLTLVGLFCRQFYMRSEREKEGSIIQSIIFSFEGGSIATAQLYRGWNNVHVYRHITNLNIVCHVSMV